MFRTSFLETKNRFVWKERNDPSLTKREVINKVIRAQAYFRYVEGEYEHALKEYKKQMRRSQTALLSTKIVLSDLAKKIEYSASVFGRVLAMYHAAKIHDS